MSLERLRNHERLSSLDLIKLIATLSFPAIMANLSSIIMEFIDAAMVGHLSSQAAAAIGLVATSTWLLFGLSMAVSIGFNVQVAQAIGAKEEKTARQIVRHGLISALILSFLVAAIGSAISFSLPTWLGGEAAITEDAGRYFLIFVLMQPLLQIHSIGCGMLQSSGNMKTPSLLNIFAGILDVLFNALLIFPTAAYHFGPLTVTLPGADLGVTGAALGTAISELIIAVFVLYFLLIKSPELAIRRGEKFTFAPHILQKAFKIALPVGLEQIIMCGAQIAATKIIAPLGMAALAANSFAVTIEGLCYMPGYGIAAAATTLIGQSIGAFRHDLTKKISWFSTVMGMIIMSFMGLLMYLSAPFVIGLLSPDTAVRTLGTTVLRIEAFAEPLYAASIIISGVFRGAGDTLVPTIINSSTMWFIRLPLAFFMAQKYGLPGVWGTMAMELSLRGLLFLIRLKKRENNLTQK